MEIFKTSEFDNKKYNPKKLLDFGFKRTESGYIYKTGLMNGQFILTVNIDNDAKLTAETTEKDSGDLYTLHLTYSEGRFVGELREEYNSILKDIAQNCYEIGIFKYENSYKIIDYIKNKYNDDVEYLWEKFPDNAVARRKDNKKWYLAILTVGKDKFGFNSNEKIEVIDLRAKPEEITALKQDYIYPGYHMNKKHWITILLDGSVDINEIFKRIDESYLLARGKNK